MICVNDGGDFSVNDGDLLCLFRWFYCDDRKLERYVFYERESGVLNEKNGDIFRLLLRDVELLFYPCLL